eukprot:1006737-Prymnesium_polylepis.1
MSKRKAPSEEGPYRYTCPQNPEQDRASLAEACDLLEARESLSSVHLLDVATTQRRLSLGYDDVLLVRLRSILLRNAATLEFLFIADCCASTELLSALDTSILWKMHVELNIDNKGAAHLCDASAWHSLDDIG